MAMLAITILVHFWMLHWITGHLHAPKAQPAALHCNLATWAMLGYSDGNSGSCMMRFRCLKVQTPLDLSVLIGRNVLLFFG